MKNILVSIFVLGAMLVGCGSDNACERGGDLAQMCDGLSDAERDQGVAFCEALLTDTQAETCVSCREAAADPCDSDVACETECNVEL